MFDTAFLAGLAALALTFAAALWVAAFTGLDPTLTLVGAAAAVWGLFWLIERRIRPDPANRPVPVHVDWEDRINETDFAASGAPTVADLAGLGLTPDRAVGQRFVFATEHAASNGDIYFEGDFLRDGDGRIIIRATEPV